MTIDDNKVELDDEVAYLQPDRIVSKRIKKGSLQYKIHWKGSHKDSWVDQETMKTEHSAILEDWKRKQEIEAKITKICGVKHKGNNYKWVVTSKDGTSIDLSGEELIEMNPKLFLSYVEGNIKKNQK